LRLLRDYGKPINHLEKRYHNPGTTPEQQGRIRQQRVDLARRALERAGRLRNERALPR
jgi:hypothetical protein